MKHLSKYNEFSINEGKISQAVLSGLLSITGTLSKLSKKITGKYIPIKFKDKKKEREVNRDIIKLLDYTLFDMMKYYFNKKYKQEADKTSFTELIKKRSGVDMYDLISRLESNMKIENIELSTDSDIRKKQEDLYNVGIETIKKYKSIFKKIDDSIKETQYLLQELTIIMSGLDPRINRTAGETLDNLHSGLDRLDRLTEPKDMNDILDKASKYGIESLTDQEKDDLDKHSKSI